MRIVIQIEEPRCKGSQWGAWLVCSKKSNEGKCGWSDMSDEKRIRDDIIEVTSVWDIGHFKGSYPDGDRKVDRKQKRGMILSYSLIKSLLIAVLQGWKQED